MSKYKELAHKFETIARRFETLENQNKKLRKQIKEVTDVKVKRTRIIGTRVESYRSPFSGSVYPRTINVTEDYFVPSMNTKVNALYKHLGLEAVYTPETTDKKVTPESIKVQKYVAPKATAKKASKK